MDSQGVDQQARALGGAGRKPRVGTGYEGLDTGWKGFGGLAGEGTLACPPSLETHKRPRPRVRSPPSPSPSPSSQRDSPERPGRVQSRPASTVSLAESFASPPPPAYDSLLISPPSPPLIPGSSHSNDDDDDDDDAQLDDLITLTRSLLLSSRRILRDGELVRTSLDRIVRCPSPPRTGSGSGFFFESARGAGGGEEEGGWADEGGRGAGAGGEAAREAGEEGVAARRSTVHGLDGAEGSATYGRGRLADDVSPDLARPQLVPGRRGMAHDLLSRVSQRRNVGASRTAAATAAIAFDTSSSFALRPPPSPPETPIKARDSSMSYPSLTRRHDAADDAALRVRGSPPPSEGCAVQDDFDSPAGSVSSMPASTPPDMPRRYCKPQEPSTPSSIASSHFSSSSKRPAHHRRSSTVSSTTTSSSMFTSTHRSATTASLSLSSFDELLESMLSSGATSGDEPGPGGGPSQARDRLKALVDGPAVASQKGAPAEGGEKAAASSSWWGWRQG